MTTPPLPGRPRRSLELGLRRARIGATGFFFTNGFVIANVLPRYPEISAHADLTDATFGLAIAMLPVGALMMGPASSWFLKRLGAIGAALCFTVLAAVALALVGLSFSWLTLAGALLLFGCADIVADVAQNANGMVVQRRLGKTVINSMHAAWSAGAFAGGVAGSAAAQAGIPLALHLGGAAVVVAALALACAHLVRTAIGDAARQDTKTSDPDTASEGPLAPPRPPAEHAAVDDPDKPEIGTQRRRILTVAGVSLIACASIPAEEAAMAWSALYLGRDLGVASGLAGLGLVIFMAAHMTGRLIADPLVDAFGDRVVARIGGMLVAAGMGTALLIGTYPAALVGFLCAGLGVASIVPAAFAASDNVPGLAPGVGLTAVTMAMRITGLGTPVLIGFIAEAVSLRLALGIVPALGVAIVMLARVLPKQAHRR